MAREREDGGTQEALTLSPERPLEKDEQVFEEPSEAEVRDAITDTRGPDGVKSSQESDEPPAETPESEDRAKLDTAKKCPEPAWMDDSPAMVASGYENEAKALGQVAEAAPLWHAAGLIHLEVLGRPRTAATCFQAALKANPAWRPSMRAARRIFARAGSWAMVAKLLESEESATTDEARRSELALERALLLRDRLNRPDEADSLLRDLGARSPSRLRVLKLLEVLAATSSDYAQLARTYREQAALVESPRLEAALLCAAANTLACRGNDVEGAKALYREVLKIDGENTLALVSLDQLLASEDLEAERVEPLLALARMSDDVADSAAALLEAARIKEEVLEDLDGSVAILEEARKRAPDDVTVLFALSRHYERSGEEERLSGVLASLSSNTADPQVKGELLLRLGNLLEHLDKSAQAAEAYRDALRAWPGDSAALAALGRLYFRSERWEDLIWTFRQEMALSKDSEQRASRGFKIAEIQEQRLGKPDAAIDTLRAILAASPGYLPAVQALTRLHEQAGRWAEVITLLESEVQRTEDVDQTVSLLDRIARIHEERLDDLAASARVRERIVEVAPDNVPALRELGRLFRRLERWEELIPLIEREARRTDDPRQVIALLHQIAEIRDERLGDREAAIEGYRKVLGVQADYLPALRALGRLLHQTGKWRELIEMFRAEIETTKNKEHAVNLLLKVGDVYEQHLHDPERAADAYRQVLERKPDSLTAMCAMERLHAKVGDWSAVVESLKAQAGLATEARERAFLLTRAASVQEARVRDIEAALATYEHALDAHPAHKPAVWAIARLRAVNGTWGALAAAYEKHLAANEPHRSKDVRRALGLLYLDRLGVLESARKCFETVLADRPDDPVSLTALDRISSVLGDSEAAVKARMALVPQVGPDCEADILYTVAVERERTRGPSADDADIWRRIHELSPGDPCAAQRLDEAAAQIDEKERIDILAKQLAVAGEDDLRLALAVRLGELSAKAGDREKAEEAFGTALAIAPCHLPALHGLKRVVAAQGRWEEVQKLLEREGEVSRDPGRAVSLLLDCTVLCEEYTKDRTAAERGYRKVLDKSPTDARAYERLLALLGAQERYEDLAELHVWRAGVVSEPSERAEARLVAARIHAEHLSAPAPALELVERALEDAPSDERALDLGATLAFEIGSWETSARLSRRRLELEGETGVLNAHRLRLAEILHEHMQATDEAVELLEKASEEDPSDRRPLRLLTDILVATKRWPEATHRLEALGRIEREPARRAAVLVELASIQADELGDTEAATATLLTARELAPDDLGAAEKLGALLESRGDWKEAVQVYTDLVNSLSPDDYEQAFSLHVRIAEIQTEELQNKKHAVRSYRSALELRPDEEQVRAALAGVFASETKHHPQAIEEHKALLARDPFRADSYHALYKLYQAGNAYDRAWCVAAVLSFLNAANEEEAFFYADNKERAPGDSDASLTPENMAQLLRHGDDSGPLAEVFLVMGNQLGRVYPADLSRFQVGRSERVSSKDGSALRHLCDTLADNLGGADFDLYRSIHVPSALESFAGDPAALVVGSEITTRNAVQAQRFLLARHVCRMVLGTSLCVQLEQDELARAVQGAVQVVNPEYRGLGVQDDPDHTKACYKSMSRKARRALDEPARLLAMAGDKVDIARFAAGVVKTSNRAGLLLSGDIEICLHILAKESGRDPRGAPSSVRGAELVEEALRFLTSEAFFKLRKLLRLSMV